MTSSEHGMIVPVELTNASVLKRSWHLAVSELPEDKKRNDDNGVQQ
jgi:hypothetical protein